MDRGHGLHPFGDMGDSSVCHRVVAKVDDPDRLAAVDDGVAPIIVRIADECDGLADEGLRDAVGSVAEADLAGGVDPSHRVRGVVFDRRQDLGVGTLAAAIARRRHLQADGLVRAFEVVEIAEGIEGALGIVEVAQQATAQQAGVQGAVEAFVLAVGLRVAGPARGSGARPGG